MPNLGTSKQSFSRKVAKLQKQTIRIINFKATDNLFKETNILKLDDFLKYIVYVKETLDGTGLQALSNFFTITQQIHNHATRGAAIFCLTLYFAMS